MGGETATLIPLTTSARVQQLSAKYDLRVPRYTSYPTAPHFHAGVGPDQYATWLSELEAGSPASLYIHIAYCADMCWFCGCHTRVTKRYEPVAEYLEAVLAEAELVASKLPGPLNVTHVHFGGGSPTILTGDDLQRTMDFLRARFGVSETAEVALEMDPRTATEEYVKAMVKAGVTRASIGVQDFEEKVQKAINRVQPMSLVENVFSWLRANGITDINMDLIYGLPHQTTETVLHTVERALALKPRRVSLFGYAHVPWMKRAMRLIDESTLPDVDARWDQYLSATDRFVELGYVPIGLDHFAAPDDEMALALRDGTLHRNFQGYTTDTAPTLIGLGASGIGYLPQGYVVNELDINEYKAAIKAGHLATKRGIAINDDDRVRRAIIERLMCDLWVDVAEVARAHGLADDAFAAQIASMDDLEADGVLVREGQVVRMTELGRPLVRAVCAKFDTYLKMGEQRHSRAV
ncbi:oxygen-independent coproporphyrinogen III oxidase [Pararhodospirillum photometricum]|uniref:Coproporphyrinogen-III oxidase n=1 Tax=Pararhodospirillum photometricum DSM 122 TaxID=1150469 RepID=H6SJU1_PARPM|nr:oxygen-independent coproporphyrinogen III oxidase [Pararhodospirillum photometricum]CCG08256.1 Coproporphyrinogen III oxidase, anaerobic [Pararhodospirillum photometricum DSM 122]